MITVIQQMHEATLQRDFKKENIQEKKSFREMLDDEIKKSRKSSGETCDSKN